MKDIVDPVLVGLICLALGFYGGVKGATLESLPDAYPIEIICIYEKEECINVWIHKDDVFMRSAND